MTDAPSTTGLHHVTNICTDVERMREFYEDVLREWCDHLRARGVRVSPIRDRTYFESIYLADPDVLTIEFATSGSGFETDEDSEERVRETAELS